MTELERALTQLAAEIEWPATPELAVPLGARNRRPRRAALLALAAVVASIAVAFAVPPARSAILRFFHIGGVKIELVKTLPAGEEQSLSAGLGNPMTASAARTTLGTSFLFPDTKDRTPLYERFGVVSAVLATPDPVLLSEFSSSSAGPILKKVLGAGTTVEQIRVAGLYGAWISGAAHLYVGPQAPARFAGNVLLWTYGPITYRLEGRTLTKELALRLAEQIVSG